MVGFDALAGHRMTDAEMDELLARSGFGVLSLTLEGQPYGIPMSFGYDDDLYFLFVAHSETGRKETCAEENGRASFLAMEVDGVDAWRSVVVEGTLERVHADEWDDAREALADNAWAPNLFTDVDRSSDPRVWALRVERMDGRKNDAS